MSLTWVSALVRERAGRADAGTSRSFARSGFVVSAFIPDWDTATRAAPGQPTTAQDRGLTQREREILALLVEGLSDREIAASLFLSPRTVGWHVTHLLTKLDVPSRTEAMAAALRHGLV